MVAWTGWSPTMGSAGSNVNSTDGTLVDGKAPINSGIGRLFRTKQERANKALLNELIGKVVGSTITANFSQVKAKPANVDPADLGGLVELETMYALGSSSAGRATVAGDVTALKAIITMASSLTPALYPADLSGNGGGGKLGR